ncbi:2-amino-3,7-dideoxy-D-threo-hept-6-ulosonate synthase [Streptomyces sp. NPDC096033]|uniref:2-amino-3,7-dideoxy-D-threo-hept-6-ulosonate synthase n=1 Tax=Streptomyces sp. NPDC096033 TaxID=3366071 RepID=UPI003824BD47
MSLHHAYGREARLHRLYHEGSRRLFVVPLDHSVTDGPLQVPGGVNRLAGQLSGSGVDAIVLHKGSVRQVDPRHFAGTSLIVHLSASTRHAPDPDAKYLVASVEEALRYGADAVSVHVNVGAEDERGQIKDLATVAESCDRWNVPLMAMMYPRGPRVTNPYDPELVAHAITLAADLGADIVKTVYVGNPSEMADVVSGAQVPVIVAGGPRLDTPELVAGYVDEALKGGAAGVAMGRNVFQAADPAALARRLADLIHADGRTPSWEAPAPAGVRTPAAV